MHRPARFFLALAFAACSGSSASSVPLTPSSPTATSASPLSETHGEAASSIIEKALADQRAWTMLEELTVGIGPRLAGSEGLDRAVAWAAETMKRDGHENVRIEKVMVPNWKRGAESAELIAPRRVPLRIIGLGGTTPTPEAGIEAEVVVVANKDELEARAAEVEGKIVLYNAIMPAYDREKGDGYDAVYEYRNNGADWAAAHGATAVLVRSLTTKSLSTPHTGGLRYQGAEKIPAAAVTTEDAEMLARLAKRGPVKVRLRLASETGPDVESGNVIAEFRGREKPDEVVVIGAHIDSWDIGGGAHDDGGGCVIMMAALTLLREMGLQPRRTIRVVLFTNEENGLRGGFAYAKDHAAELSNHILAMESDGGVFAPRGFMVEGERGLAHAQQIAELLKPLRAMEVKEGFSGADLIPMIRSAGVVGVGHWVEGEKYFDIHHTEADTIDKVDPKELAENVAAVAVFAYVAAEMEERFGGPPPSPAAATPTK